MIDTAKHGHAQKRSILAQALGEGALKAMEETILQSVRQFCKLLKDQSQQDVNLHEPGWSSSKDMAVLAGRLSFDVMNQVCFGHGSDTLEKEDDRYILDVISDGVQCLNTVRATLDRPPSYSLTTSRSATCSPYSSRELINCYSAPSSTDSSDTKHSASTNAPGTSKTPTPPPTYSPTYRAPPTPRPRHPSTPPPNSAAKAASSSSPAPKPPPQASPPPYSTSATTPPPSHSSKPSSTATSSTPNTSATAPHSQPATTCAHASPNPCASPRPSAASWRAKSSPAGSPSTATSSPPGAKSEPPTTPSTTTSAITRSRSSTRPNDGSGRTTGRWKRRRGRFAPSASGPAVVWGRRWRIRS